MRSDFIGLMFCHAFDNCRCVINRPPPFRELVIPPMHASTPPRQQGYGAGAGAGGGAGVPESPLGHFMQEQFGANPERAPPPRQPNFASATGTTLSNSSLEIWRL